MSLHKCIITTLLLLLCKLTNVDSFCPVDFKGDKYELESGEVIDICYKLKGLETFNDKFTNCPVNLFSSRLYHKITKPKITLWTDYKSLYPGGPFIDWSYTKTMGNMLPLNHSVHYDPLLRLDEDELCIIIHPVTNFTAVKCNEKHYRYCIFNSIEEKVKDIVRCEHLEEFNYWRFWTPIPTCLALATSIKERKDSVTWSQAERLCNKRLGNLISTGWRYISSPLFDIEMAPLGIMLNSDNKTLTTINENITVRYLLGACILIFSPNILKL